MSTAAAPQPAVTAGAQEEGSQPSLVLPLLQFPSVAVLFLWMIVPLGMTIYFSFIRKNLLNPELSGFAGLENYRLLWEDPAFIPAIINSIILTSSTWPRRPISTSHERALGRRRGSKVISTASETR